MNVIIAKNYKKSKLSMIDFIITESAAKKIKSILEKSNNSDKTALRIVVDGGGCSGFKYNYNPENQINEDDFVFVKNNAKVVIDKVSYEFVKGSKLNYIIELGSEYFEISNPNIKSGCGCGNSFSI